MASIKDIAVHGGSITSIFTMDDFPAPVGGVITLTTGKYIIENNLTFSERFVIPPSTIVTIEVNDSHNITMTYTGSDTLFTATDLERLAIDKYKIAITGDNAKVFDLMNGALSLANGRIDFTGENSSLGSHTDGSVVSFRSGTLNGFTSGMSFIDCTAISCVSIVATPYILSTESAFKLIGTSTLGAIFDIVPAIIGPNGSFIYIDPVFDKPVNIQNISQIGPGAFFAPSTKSGTVTLVTDKNQIDVGVTSVADNGNGKARFTSIGHNLAVGETINHTTFTEGTYNGNDLIVTAVTTDTYDIETISYVATDTGLFTSLTVEMTSAGHGLVNGETIWIPNTVYYGGGQCVFNVTIDTFEVTATFGTTETFEWGNGSQTQQTEYVNLFNCGSQKNSSVHGEGVMGGNTTPTDIVTQGAYVDLNLGPSGLLASADIEQWTITNQTTGEMRYDGVVPVDVHVDGVIAATSSGGTKLYKFRMLKNGLPLAAPDNVDVPMEVKATLVSSPILWSSDALSGDKFRLQVANYSDTTDIVIDTIKQVIRG